MSDADKPTLIQTNIPQTFDIKVGDKTQTVRMTFGRLNRICKLVGDMNEVGRLVQDPEMQEQVLVELLSPSKSERVNIDDLDIAPADISNIIAWAGVHVLDFFMRLASNFNEGSEPLMNQMVGTLDRMRGKVATLDQVQTSLTGGPES